MMRSPSAATKREPAKRALDEIDRLYHCARWRIFRSWMLAQNPICQKIQKDGTQCREWATLVHHLVSPRKRRDLFTDSNNVVCLCAACHPTDEGTPWWTAGKEYVKSEFRLPNLGGNNVQ